MGARPWNRELIYGAAAAIVVPVVLSVVWPKGLRTAGIVVGLAVAALLHVTVAVGAISAGYQLLEHRQRAWGPPRAILKIVLTVLAIGALALTVWMCHRY
jgi:peptidoglycan biosynthesis protein MviN/MurJ (putative lipid II flippase)